ncbi:Transmembrane protease serine 2 [Mactra antiquata]
MSVQYMHVYIISIVLLGINVLAGPTHERSRRFVDSPDNVCQFTLDASINGTILSPQFGQSTYPPNLICTWTLIAPVGETIRLTFNSFRLDNTRSCRGDYLRIFDGITSFSNTIGRYCGEAIPGDVASTGNEMLVFFRSDGQAQYAGFNISYGLDIQTVTVVEPEIEGCNGHIKYLANMNGYITSPGYDGHSWYKDDMECNWLIDSPPRHIIRLVFQDFLTEKIDGCTYDYLAIHDGNSNTSTNIAQLCGLLFPDDIYSSGSSLFLTFKSDADVAGTGFNLTYEVLPDSYTCNKFRCGDGSCVFNEFVCNNYTECPDASDEAICGTSNCGRPSIQPIEANTKIVGGRMALEHSWPWMVSLRINGSHICGGAIIHESWVITAAHCFERNRHAVEWTVAAGKHNKEKPDSTEQIRQAELITVNSKYNYFSSVNDIALVKIDKPFTINTYVSTVCLPERDPIPGEQGFVTGWGEVLGTCCPDVLKQVSIPIVNLTVCNAPDHLGHQVTNDMFCAGYEQGGYDACQGDSGGPFVIKQNGVWKIHGITSFGSLCAAPKSPGVYTNVFHYLHWIREKVAANF